MDEIKMPTWSDVLSADQAVEVLSLDWSLSCISSLLTQLSTHFYLNCFCPEGSTIITATRAGSDQKLLYSLTKKSLPNIITNLWPTLTSCWGDEHFGDKPDIQQERLQNLQWWSHCYFPWERFFFFTPNLIPWTKGTLKLSCHPEHL